jgi:ribose transport system permease protein
MSQAPASLAGSGPSRTVRSGLQQLARIPSELLLVAFLLGLVIYFSANSDVFLTIDNLRNILLSVTVLGIVAVPSTMLMVSGNVDLSVGSAAAFCGMLFAVTADDHGLVLSLAIALVAGAVIGAVNGTLVALIGINSIITTLGMLSILRGATKLLSNGQTTIISGFDWLGSGEMLGLPVPVWFFAGIACAFYLLMRYTVFGRDVYALGSNAHAARLVGIRPAPRLFALFVITWRRSCMRRRRSPVRGWSCPWSPPSSSAGRA